MSSLFFFKKTIRSSRGQGLVEYLIIVCLMAVATMGIVRVLNKTVQVKFANVTAALQGNRPRNIRVESLNESDYKKKDMSDFFNGASSQDQ